MTRILATGRSVVLLGPVPEMGQDIPSAFARHALLDWAPLPAPVTLDDYEARSGRTERILMRIADAHERVRYVPLSDLFCDTHLCRMANAENALLYVDDDHISKTAALTLLLPRLADIWQ